MLVKLLGCKIGCESSILDQATLSVCKVFWVHELTLQIGNLQVGPKKGKQTHGLLLQPVLGPSPIDKLAVPENAWDQWQMIGFVPVSEQRNADMACKGSIPCSLVQQWLVPMLLDTPVAESIISQSLCHFK